MVTPNCGNGLPDYGNGRRLSVVSESSLMINLSSMFGIGMAPYRQNGGRVSSRGSEFGSALSNSYLKFIIYTRLLSEKIREAGERSEQKNDFGLQHFSTLFLLQIWQVLINCDNFY